MTPVDTTRAPVDDVVVVHPLASMVPPILLADEITRGLLGGLDQMLAPVVWMLDHLDAYVDPVTAPPPFLRWIAGWLGLGPVVDLLPALHRRPDLAVACERRLVLSTVRQLAAPTLATAHEVAVGEPDAPRAIVDAARCRGSMAALVETLDVVLGPICSVTETGRTDAASDLTTEPDDASSAPVPSTGPQPAVRVAVDAWELPAHPDVVREAVRRVAALHVPANVTLEIVVACAVVAP